MDCNTCKNDTTEHCRTCKRACCTECKLSPKYWICSFCAEWITRTYAPRIEKSIKDIEYALQRAGLALHRAGFRKDDPPK